MYEKRRLQSNMGDICNDGNKQKSRSCKKTWSFSTQELGDVGFLDFLKQFF